MTLVTDDGDKGAKGGLNQQPAAEARSAERTTVEGRNPEGQNNQQPRAEARSAERTTVEGRNPEGQNNQ